MRTFPTKLLAIASACALGLVACKGDKGDTGAAGTTGATGANGISTGVIAGALTYQPASTALPATGVSVNVVPDVGLASAMSAADGTYTLADVPIGTYTVTFSGSGFTAAQTTGVVVVAGRTTAVSKLLVASNPIVLAAVPATAPAGFGAAAQLNVTVSGGTAPDTFAWTARAANPTAVTLSDATVQNPTFTTGTLKDVAASGKVAGIVTRSVPSFIAISAQQLAQMTYNFDCKVTDATGFSKTVTVAVPPATLAQGNGIVPLNQIVVLNVPGNATALGFTAKPAGSNAVLNEADQVNPWFIPDVAGDYTVAGLTVNASNFTSANPNCGGCHNTTVRAAVATKFTAWNDSAHGNHFFKYMEYDSGGNLVWRTDASGNPIPAPTADPAIFWTAPGAMTTFEFGMTGAEGSHYSASCVACHTTGFNLLASNNGADDAMAAAGWTFPNLKTAFGGDATTPAPNFTVWNAIPDSVKAYAGMQCESCHGPLGGHEATVGTVKPVPEYDIGACAVCHDRPSNHDRVFLWRQSMHADLVLAEEESVVESRGVSTSCYRCHSAQGFVAYLPQQQGGNAGNIARPAGLTPAPATCTPTPQPGGDVDPNCPCTPASGQTTCTGDPAFYAYLSGLGLNRAQVQPQTCAACHDPHATEIRVDGNTGPLANGYQMQGAGAGALCMVCHNTRNGARGDFVTVSSIGGPHAPVQADLFFGQNAYFMGAGGQVSKHAAVQETCVGCHMLLHPTSLRVTNTNHTFAVDGTICSACHSSGVGLDALEGQFMVNRGNLEKALATAFTAAVGGANPNYYVLASNPTSGGSPAYAVVNLTTAPTNIVPSGRSQNLTMTFPTAVDNGFGGTATTLTVNFQRVSLSSATNAGVTAFTTPLFSTTGIIAKANWNYWLVSSVTANPAANVIHNPSFVWEVLANTSSALLASGGVGL